MKQIISFLIVFGFAPNLFGQCMIGINTYNDGDENPNNGCLVCDVDESTTAWSPRDCSAVEDVCVVGACVLDQANKPVCEPRTLPKFARCSPPVCSNGAISQGECSDTTPRECNTVEKRTCDGFVCLDETECAVQCAGPNDCRDGYACNNNVCERVSNPDMGNDGGNQDVGIDVLKDVRVELDVSVSDSGSDADDTRDSGGPGPGPITGGDGCCATTSQQFNPLLLVVAVVAVGLRRRRRRFTA